MTLDNSEVLRRRHSEIAHCEVRTPGLYPEGSLHCLELKVKLLSKTMRTGTVQSFTS